MAHLETHHDLLISGPIHLRTVGSEEHKPSWSINILLLGETGVGKSNFLECLHGDRSLNIAGNQLEAVTQNITVYELMNAKHKPKWDLLDGLARRIFLIDTPGFGDSQTSEAKVVKMIQEWLRKGANGHDFIYINFIWYFHRITDKRMAGSQTRIANLVKALCGEKSDTSLYVITTMWDTLWTQTQKSQAEERFRILSEQHWQEAVLALKFLNTTESALEITGKRDFALKTEDFTLTGRTPIHNLVIGSMYEDQMQCARLLYGMILERIEGLHQRINILEEDLSQEATCAETELYERLSADKASAAALLVDLEKEAAAMYPATFLDPQETQGFRDSVFRRWKKLRGKYA